MSRTIVVSSFPPRPCGIGAYAVTQVARLREEGERVTVVSPPDGEGDVRVRFDSGRPFLAAIRASSRGDGVLVHFQPALYYLPRAPLAKVLASLGLLWLTMRRRTEILVHEADPPKRWRPDYAILAAALRRATLLFHTRAERAGLERAYRLRARARIVPHVGGVRVGEWPRAEARRRVDVPEGDRLLVCPGFLHPDKGYERAVQAFARVGEGRLAIVGGVKDPTPANLAYATRLRALVARTPRASLVERYVGDDEFDAWIAAADAVVLPYRRSWSSGALARAQALGTRAIVMNVGGLGEQAAAADLVVESDGQLEEAMRAVLRGEVLAG